jgi:hypothetical protein
VPTGIVFVVSAPSPSANPKSVYFEQPLGTGNTVINVIHHLDFQSSASQVPHQNLMPISCLSSSALPVKPITNIFDFTNTLVGLGDM